METHTAHRIGGRKLENGFEGEWLCYVCGCHYKMRNIVVDGREIIEKDNIDDGDTSVAHVGGGSIRGVHGSLTVEITQDP